MNIAGIASFSFAGLSYSAGPVSVLGLKAGDVVLSVVWGNSVQPPNALFESVITVDDEIQQVDSADDLSIGIQIIIARAS